MIKLDIMDRCQSCIEFEASTDTVTLYGDYGVVEKETVIGCKHRKICENIEKYLEKCNEESSINKGETSTTCNS